MTSTLNNSIIKKRENPSLLKADPASGEPDTGSKETYTSVANN